MKVVALRPNKEGTSVADLAKMNSVQMAELSTKTINRLSYEIYAAMAELKLREAELQLVIEDRYSDELAKERKAKEFGLVRVEDGDYVVEQTVPKNVSWDQDSLNNICHVLTQEWDEDPDQYISAKLSVEEKKYNAWPDKIKQLFQPARTIKPGKSVLKIKRKSNDA